MYTTSELIRAGRLTSSMTAEEYEDWLATERAGKETFYSMFIAPDGFIEAGDVVIVDADTAHRDGCKVPVVVGEWNEMVFRGALTDPADWTPTVDRNQVYIAPMDGRDVVVK